MSPDQIDKIADEELTRKRATRAANRGVVTKIIEESDGILESDTALQDIKSWKRLQRILKMLNEKMDLLKVLDEKILNACKVDDIMKEVEEADFFKMRIMDAIANITSYTTTSTVFAPTASNTSPDQTTTSISLNTSTSSDSPTLPASTSTSNVASNTPITPSSTLPSASASMSLDSSASFARPNSNSSPRPSKSRLPKITLAKFRGDITQFRSFWDSFESTVHANTDLTKIDKFNYLVSLLEGTASRAIAGLPITEDNYDAAVDILHKRFGKPQQLIAAHMDELLKISACSSDKPNQLRFLYDKLSVNIRGLKALGVKADRYGSLLIPIIMAKRPLEIRVHVARNTAQDVWDIKSILEVIQREIEAREIGEKVKAMTSSHNEFVKRLAPPRKSGNSTLGTFLTGSTPLQTPKCVYCTGKHFSASCEITTDINTRKSILRRDRRCFTCLGKNHNAGHCEKRCRKCGSHKHHQSICPEQYKLISTASEEQAVKDTEVASTTTATTTSENSNPKRRVLLQTATAIASNQDQTQSTKVRILFDNGSQRSYITDGLRSKLQLKAAKSEKLNLNTFGESKIKKQNCDVVELQLRKSEFDDPISITALTFPVICSPLPANLSTSYAHLDGLELADEPSNSKNSIDLLVGSLAV